MLQIIHLEMRLAFKACARTPSFASARCRISTFPSLQARNRDIAGAAPRLYPAKSVEEVTKLTDDAEPHPPTNAQQKSSRSNSTSLVPQTPQAGAFERPQRSDIPARLLPKAQISPNLTLSPKERLQIEYETRRPPKASVKPGEQHGTETSNDRRWRLTCCSLQRTSVDLPCWANIHQLHSATTSIDPICYIIWSHSYGSGLLLPWNFPLVDGAIEYVLCQAERNG